MSVVVGKRAKLRNWIKYSAYGVPFGLPGGDTDSDGDCDSTDVTQIQTWIDGPTYNVLGDIDLDGDVDTEDKSTIQNGYEGDTGGRQTLTPNASRHRRGFAGRSYDQTSLYQVRRRVFAPATGHWISRDSATYRDSMSMYSYVAGQPVGRHDPSGAFMVMMNEVYVLALGIPLYTDRQCCDLAKARGEDFGSGGGVVCCSGRYVACSWVDEGDFESLEGSDDSAPPDEFTINVISDCVGEHETEHTDPGDNRPCSEGRCRGRVVCRAERAHEVPSAAFYEEEVDGYQAELDCLSDAPARCEQAPDPPACRQWVSRWRRSTEGHRDNMIELFEIASEIEDRQ